VCTPVEQLANVCGVFPPSCKFASSAALEDHKDPAGDVTGLVALIEQLSIDRPNRLIMTKSQTKQ
jgi:hypothetical protein